MVEAHKIMSNNQKDLRMLVNLTSAKHQQLVFISFMCDIMQLGQDDRMCNTYNHQRDGINLCRYMFSGLIPF